MSEALTTLCHDLLHTSLQRDEFKTDLKSPHILDPPDALYTTCYGFVGLALQRICKPAYQELYEHMCAFSAPSYDWIPAPIHYSAFLRDRNYSRRHWRIINLPEAKSGDILVYHNPKANKSTHTYGQHVGVVARVTRLASKHFSVKIYDVSKYPHGPTDRRPGAYGTGTIEVYMDDHNSLTGLKWHPNARRTLQREITVARIASHKNV